ncbi:S8 family serine peptidase [Phytoactinopolyspora alkaliphila]|uniref:S8 family serine peptidase n=1 Tax=Phytoactinopolyspora alkaliphila TaxID=1783498 RepID=A0A6N9YJS1_9ACTN|nr:S8 family serine peptidase [Phytoactinopolyspora alkaliphila]NED95243.1 S8 family serine peptidase [Phytoactinopolyspora alkaliphila]
MHILRAFRSGRRPRAVGLAIVVLLVLTGGTLLPAASQPDPRASGAAAAPSQPETAPSNLVASSSHPETSLAGLSGPAGPTGSWPGSGAGSVPRGTYRVTLVTGDVVVLQVSADGVQSVLEYQAPAVAGPQGHASPGPEGVRTAPAPRVDERDGHLHVIPAEAEPYLASGVLDPRLFNVSLLVEQGYHDDATGELPLMLLAPDGPSTMDAVPTPRGVREERQLPSIGAISVSAEKQRLRETWESLRGREPAPLDASGAELSTVSGIWLNGKVTAALDESAAQVGAPEAWDSGYDGSGVTVAVLDSGYDPNHPDLVGQVVAAQDFTDVIPGEPGPGDPDPGEPLPEEQLPEEQLPGENTGDSTATGDAGNAAGTARGDAVAADANGHGTHVAATIAGTGAASNGAYTGIAPGAKLLIGKVLNDAGSGMEDWIIASMEWAVAEGADVVNMSLGTPYTTDGTDPMSQAVNRLSESSNSLFVVAAGNMGPQDESVTSPGAATEALTVGAVTKDDRIADFSSRGPRVGDGALKPEIVAPGVDIVAARASGTSLGNLLDEHYTSLNGTSMAAPHVAGAAAILAQQRPDLGGRDLKNRLISTSQPLEGVRLPHQGAGRLDVMSAVDDTVSVDESVLTLGELPEKGEVVRTLTFHNPLDRKVTLRLSGALSRHGDDGKGKPVLRFRKPVLSIPAGGEASTDVRFTAEGIEGGTYTGHIVGTDPRNRENDVRAVTSFTVPRPLHELTVEAVDRRGDPANVVVDVWNNESEEYGRFFGPEGRATGLVPEGDYTVVTTIDTPDGPGAAPGHTLAGDPDVTIAGDVDLHYDAAGAEPVRVETELETDLDMYHFTWNREIDGRAATPFPTTGLFGDELSVFPSPEPQEGTFEFASTWQFVEPIISADLTGPQGFELTTTPYLSQTARPFVGEADLPIVYAGTGTPDELAAVDVEGAAVLVTRAGDGDIDQWVRDVEDAGAALVLAHNDRPGRWRGTAWSTDFPLYMIDQETGERLRRALAEDPTATLAVRGLQDHGYAYQLAFFEPGGIPGARTYRTADHPMAQVTSDYREDSDRMSRNEMWVPYVDKRVLGSNFNIRRHGPVVRTDHISTEGVEWQRFALPHYFASLYWSMSEIEPYEAGETYEQLWWGPLTHPGVADAAGLEEYGAPVARFRDAIRVGLSEYLYGPVFGEAYGDFGDVSKLTLRSDGAVVDRMRGGFGQFTVPPVETEIELTLEVAHGDDHFADTSVRTETTWSFTSGRTGERRTVLPLVQADYHLETGQYNEVPAGSSYSLVVEPGYQREATGPGDFTIAVEVSYDDGDSWTEAPVTSVDGRFAAMVPAADGDGFASVRVVATDADGNQLDQRIDRAWRTAE